MKSKWIVMSSTESEEDVKGSVRQPDPLCLFCYPTDCPCEEEAYISKQTECNPGESSEKVSRKKWLGAKMKQEMWLRRRTEMNHKRRRRMFEPGKHLKSYFLVTVKPAGDQQRVYVPCLVKALETLKDAWPPNKRQSIERYLDNARSTRTKESSGKKFAMIKEKSQNQVPFSRRSSMPEEFIRKYFLKKGISSEESETNQTLPDADSGSSKDSEEKNQKYGDDLQPCKHEYTCRKNDRKVLRVTQNDYDKQGKGIIKQRTKEKGLQTGRSTETSERDDTEDNRTSESLSSSSPTEILRPISTSENLTSESEDVKCTCAEIISSKDTSTDLFQSGNSTLSQTVSEKSTSTQDSTISIHSVSTGGSTITAESNSTSPDVFGKTSAKESISPERTPRVIIFRSRRNICRFHGRKYPKFFRKVPYCPRRHKGKGSRENSRCKNETGESTKMKEERQNKNMMEKSNEKYKWAKYAEEELYMIQQMRHKKFIENIRRFSIPVSETPDGGGSVSACAASGSTYRHMDELEDRILIPRYSALPRTVSMLVNTSSGDTNNSDSDSLSLADSLEEFPIVHVHQMSHDTKKELKPVRGDLIALPENKKFKKKKHPRSRAFFVSMKDPYGEDELLTGITKIPEPPERIKERIKERQLNILNLHKRNMERRRDEAKDKKRHRRNLKERRYTKDKKELQSGKEKEEASEKLHQGMKHSSRRFDPRKITNEVHPSAEEEIDRRRKTWKEGLSQTEVPSRTQRTIGKTDKKQTTEKKKNGRFHNTGKPQAVIHPSMPVSESDQSCRNKQAANQCRPLKYRQKFEVIPEEKSSSMSSTDETKKTGSRSSLQEKSNTTTSICGNSELSTRYNLGTVSNLVLAKIMEKTIQEISSGNQSIILVSPKTPHSRKGRDALLALNRGDFNRLSKGWMNFYLLKETSDASEDSSSENGTKSRNENRSTNSPYEKEKTSEFFLTEKSEDPNVKSERFIAKEREETVEEMKSLSEDLRFHSSNTILRSSKESPEKKLSLPELKVASAGGHLSDHQSNYKNSTLVLPKVPHVSPECDGMDSDSTVYCQPPSLIVPRLTFDGSGDFPSEDSLSETNSESGEAENKSSKLLVKHFPLRKRGLCQRPRLRRDGHHESTKHGSQDKADYSGWSVTVAGTLELSNGTPDLEMRLSFPANGCGPPQASQSDSGFADEGSQNIETSGRTFDREVRTDGSVKQKWTVTVKNPKEGDLGEIKRRSDRAHVLPNIGQSQSRNVKKVLKNEPIEGEFHRKISIYWPKMDLVGGDWANEMAYEEGLSVRGSAIAMEKKPGPLKNTEKDITRG